MTILPCYPNMNVRESIKSTSIETTKNTVFIFYFSEYTGFIIQPAGLKHVITQNFSRDFIPLIIIL